MKILKEKKEKIIINKYFVSSLKTINKAILKMTMKKKIITTSKQLRQLKLFP